MQKRTLEVGITGGIGAGKSTVCKIFSCFHIPVYNADSRAKQIMKSEEKLIEQIRQELNLEPIDKQGALNKKALRSLFGRDEQLKKLNELVHPWVLRDYKKWKKQQQGKHYIIKEAALLIEAQTAKHLDKLIVVSAPQSLRIKRVLDRDRHRNEQEVHTIIARQATEKERLTHADYTIVNDDKQLVVPQVWKLHQLLTAMCIPPTPHETENPSSDIPDIS